MAQELFPELAGIGKRSNGTSQQAAEEVSAPQANKTEETVVQVDVVFDGQVPEAAVASQETSDKAEEEEEDADEKNKKIQIYMANAESTITPNTNFSYCFGQIKFANEMKKPVQALTVEIVYGPYPNTYNIRNLVKDSEQSESVTFVGETCKHILEMPKVTIKRCVVEKMTEAECKKRVEFIPLRGS